MCIATVQNPFGQIRDPLTASAALATGLGGHMGTYLSWWGVLPPAGEPDHELQDKSKHTPSVAATYRQTPRA